MYIIIIIIFIIIVTTPRTSPVHLANCIYS